MATTPAAAPTVADLASVMELVDAGHFPQAASLAFTVSEDRRGAALSSVFARWCLSDPSGAALGAISLRDDGAERLAWTTVVSEWARMSPAGLAAFAVGLPAGEERRHALGAAVGRWVDRDAAAARGWVGRLPSGPETDGLVATIAQQSELIDAQPDVALSWAESVSDPALRSRVIGCVVREWLEFAPEDATRYAYASPYLTPSEREDILVGERFTPHP